MSGGGEPIVQTYEARDAGMVNFMSKLRNELAKERQARQSLQKEMTQQAQQQRSIARERAGAARRRATEEKQLAKVARDAVDSLKTPFERYEKKLHELQRAVDANKLSTDQFRRKKRQLLETMREEKRQLDGTNDEMREAAQLVDRTRTATERYEAVMENVNRLHRRGRIDGETRNRVLQQERQRLEEATPAAQSFGQRMGEVFAGVTAANLAMEAGRRVIAALRQEYDRLIERQRRALELTRPLAAAQVEAVHNLGNDPDVNAQQLTTQIRSESQRLGIDESQLTSSVSSALASRGENSVDDAVESVIAATELSPFDSEAQRVFSGAALDLSNRNERGLRGSLGFLLEVGARSRVTDSRLIARNATPAINAATQLGASEEFGGALFATLTQGATDTEGSVSRTGVINFVRALSEWSDGHPEQAFHALVTLPGAREDFFASTADGGAGASFDAQVDPTIQSLITPGTVDHNRFMANLQGLQGVDGDEAFRGRVSQIDRLEAVQTARADQAIRNLNSQVSLADQSDAVSAAIREGMADLRQGLGQGAVYSEVSGFVDDVESGGTLDLEGLLTELRSLNYELQEISEGRGRRAEADAADEISRAFAVGEGLAIGPSESRFLAREAGLTGELEEMSPEVARRRSDAVSGLIELVEEQLELQRRQVELQEDMARRQGREDVQRGVQRRIDNGGEAAQ